MPSKTMARETGSPSWPGRSEVEAASNAVLMLNRCGTCSTCNGYFGSANDQPVCSTCHAFLYANDLDAEGVALHQSEDRKDNDDSDRDSGNEEPPEQDPSSFYPSAASASSSAGLAVAATGADDLGSRRRASDGNGQSGDGRDRWGNPAEAAMANEAGDAQRFRHSLADENDPIFSGDDDNQELELLSGAHAPEHPVLRNGYLPIRHRDGRGSPRGGRRENGRERPPLDLRPLQFNVRHQQGLKQDLNGAILRNWHKPPPPPQYNHHLHRVHVESLSDRIALLTIPRNDGDELPAEMVKSLPPEILMIIFSFLDDISLYAVANVCKRWKQLVMTLTQWEEYTRRRWPLYKPLTPVSDWFGTYSSLMDSCFCLTCIYQMAEVPRDINSGLRKKRLDHDLRGLVLDPPEGIKAQPLDSSYYHWQASVTGPIGSPYEGGLFYLYLKIPFNYPFDPPEVRFLSKIFHPNVSRHGDVGIDSILKHGWAVSLRISTVLISIQSLLTDPYTNVCMEPDIGRLYDNNRKLFDSVARLWTWRFAMLDVPALSRKRVV